LSLLAVLAAFGASCRNATLADVVAIRILVPVGLLNPIPLYFGYTVAKRLRILKIKQKIILLKYDKYKSDYM